MSDEGGRQAAPAEFLCYSERKLPDASPVVNIGLKRGESGGLNFS
jgi:hypothetical protein